MDVEDKRVTLKRPLVILGTAMEVLEAIPYSRHLGQLGAAGPKSLFLLTFVG
jgi:hypothetical protein